MAPTESLNGPKSVLGATRGRGLALVVWGLFTFDVALAQAQDDVSGPAVEPTIGAAVATERVTSGTPETPTAEAPSAGVQPAQPSAPSATTALPAPAAVPLPTATGSSMMEAVRGAASRQLVPAEDLRLRKLDTSFPAEQPEFDVIEPERDVVAGDPGVSPRGTSRRTVVRVVNGVTVLTNVTDEPGAGEPGDGNAESPRVAGLVRPDQPQNQAALVALPRDVAVNSNALTPDTKAATGEGLGLWLWVLSGFAVLLLVPIAVLLTRPVRKG